MGDKWWIHVWITHWRIWKDFLTHWGASGVEQRNWNRKENKEMGEKIRDVIGKEEKMI